MLQPPLPPPAPQATSSCSRTPTSRASPQTSRCWSSCWMVGAFAWLENMGSDPANCRVLSRGQSRRWSPLLVAAAGRRYWSPLLVVVLGGG